MEARRRRQGGDHGQKLVRKAIEGDPATREQRVKLLEEHVRQLRERAGITLDLAALEKMEAGGPPRPASWATP